MDSLFLIIELIVFGVVVYWIGMPLIKKGPSSQVEWWEDELENLQENDKEAVLSTLNEIEFDYSTGKLAEDDYKILKNKYKALAVKFIEEEESEFVAPHQEIDGSTGSSAGSEIDEEIEEELRRLKAEEKGGE